MMKKIYTALAIVGLIVSTAVAAETEAVSISCEEFIKVTGKHVSCDTVPIIKMSAERWDAEQAAAEARNAPDANVPPWERQAAPDTQPKAKTIGEIDPCSVPIWKRPDGAKCD